MNDKDLEKWRSDFNLTSEQLEYIRTECSHAIEWFKKYPAKEPIRAAVTIEKFRKLSDALYQINEQDRSDLAAFAFLDEERSLQKLYSSRDFLGYSIPYLEKLCTEAVKNYEISDIKIGGRPERIPGRRFLAIEVAMIMKSAGIVPTKTPETGAFACLLQVVFSAAGINPDNIPTKSVLYYAVDLALA